MRIKLQDGTAVEIEDQSFARGAEGELFFSKDKQHVVKHYFMPDQERVRTLDACLTRFNVYSENPDYWRERLGWPNAIVTEPWFGMRMYRVPGKTRTLAWYVLPKPAMILSKEAPEMVGDWRGRVQMTAEMARTVWYALQSRGLCHADFSFNNFLGNAAEGKLALIDCDGLVIPGQLRANVLGTPGFMAPEIYMGKETPSVDTDKHALAVLIYWLMLFRHPLGGRKVHSQDPETDDRLMFGERALYTEHPTDTSNRPRETRYLPAATLGPELAQLFITTFVDTLYRPKDRPNAAQWAKALDHLLDRLIECANPKCPLGSFALLDNTTAVCPACGTPQRNYPHVPILQFYTNVGSGIYSPIAHNAVVGWRGRTLHIWHVDHNKSLGPNLPESEKGVMADFQPYKDAWRLTNRALPEMYVMDNISIKRLALDASVTLQHDMRLIFGSLDSGRVALVQLRTMI